MERISKSEAVEGIKGLFELKTWEERVNGRSFYFEKDGTTSFFFDKRQYEREEVVSRLYKFFSTRVIDGGQCRVDGMTLLYTIVYVEDRAVPVQEQIETEIRDITAVPADRL